MPTDTRGLLWLPRVVSSKCPCRQLERIASWPVNPIVLVLAHPCSGSGRDTTPYQGKGGLESG